MLSRYLSHLLSVCLTDPYVPACVLIYLVQSVASTTCNMLPLLHVICTNSFVIVLCLYVFHVDIYNVFVCHLVVRSCRCV